MTPAEIQAMAKEAGFMVGTCAGSGFGQGVAIRLIAPELERFAALVAAKAAADERAACAQVCDRFDTGRRLTSDFKVQEMAAAIRARGVQP